MEDMIVYWNKRGEVLAKVIIVDDISLEKIEEHIYPAMMDSFGKDENGEAIVDNSSYEHSSEWEE